VTNTIRVLVVDDHFVVRKGVCALLMDAGDIAVAGEARDGQEAIEQARLLKPQVILMDLRLPGGLDGVEATRAILAEQPDVGVVVLTGSNADAQVLAAVQAGALGYLAKTSEREQLLAAIRQVARGDPWLPPRLTRKLLAHLKPGSGVPADPLTDREMEVLRLLAQGKSNQQIAEGLNISEVTVRTHVSHIFAKLGAGNRVEAALYALRAGVTSLEEP
jgi:DNA-binding NarL/FixJ family response regulator